MSFIYGDNTVFYDGLCLGEYILLPVIYIADCQKSWRYVYIGDIFYTWFQKGLINASPNEQVMFDLEFGDGEYFKLLGFVHMLEKRIENK